MNMKPHSNSKHILESGYDPETKTLRMKFNNGTVYDHHGVPAEHFEKLHSEKSAGTYFHANVRGRFKHTKVEE